MPTPFFKVYRDCVHTYSMSSCQAIVVVFPPEVFKVSFFFFFRNHTVRFGAVRCGLYFLVIVRCGSVRLSRSRNPTVRLSAFFFSSRCGTVTVLIFELSYGAVRCGLLVLRIVFGEVIRRTDVYYGAVERVPLKIRGFPRCTVGVPP